MIMVIWRVQPLVANNMELLTVASLLLLSPQLIHGDQPGLCYCDQGKMQSPLLHCLVNKNLTPFLNFA